MGSKKTILKRTTAYVLAFVMAFSLLFTGNNAVTASAAAKTVKSIKVAKTKVTLDAGKTAKVKVTVKGANKKFTVKSTNSSVATAKVKGKNVVITAKAAGSAKIKVTTKGKKKGKKLNKTIKVTVKGENKQEVTGVSVTLNPASIKVNETSQATATATPAGVTTTFTYASSDTKVATVDATGKITGVAAGTAEITATSANNVSGKATITVTVAEEDPSNKYNNVKITTPTTTDGSAPSVNVGKSTKLTASVDAQDASLVKWSVSDSNVAVISEDGTLTGVSNGKVDAIATMNGKEIGRISIEITLVSVTGVSLNQKKLELTEGTKGTLTATVTPSNATNRTVTWTSQDDNVATVDNNGAVTARKAGKTIITVTTTDKSFTDTCEVTVVATTNNDTNTIEAKVSNSLADYSNTVLVGTDARIDFDVIKDGAKKDDRVHVDLEGISGYYELYDLDVTDVQTENGHGYFYVRFDKKNSAGKEAKPIVSGGEDYAFASFRITLTAGGANVHTEEPIKLSFAQVIPVSLRNNRYDSSITANPAKDSVFAQTGSYYNIERNVYNEDGFAEEYIVDQQVTEPNYDAYHEVEFDAAPTLLLPATVAGKERGKWSSNVSFEFKDYGTYSNEEQGYTINGVPGGLKNAQLVFNYFQISQYSQFIVRAYYADTERPIRDENGNLIQKVVQYDETVIEANSSKNNTIQIGEEVFNKYTRDIGNIDLKIFVQSEGQVNNSTNKGFKLKGIKGSYENEDEQPYEPVRLKEAVKWQLGGDSQYGYTAYGRLDNPQSYIGGYYSAGSTYEYTTPTYPYVGNAIIKETSTSGVVRYYLYPSVVVDEQNVLKAPANSKYAFLVSDEQVVELTSGKYKKEITDQNKLKIDTRYAGYLPIKATVQYGEKDNKGNYAIDYDLYSFVQWSPIPPSEKVVPGDYYALAGQKITLKAYVHDGVNKVSETDVQWNGISENAGYTIAKTTQTNTYGIATLELICNSAKDIENVYAVADNYTVELAIDTTGSDASVKGNERVSTGHATLHWVKPGIYYKSSLNGKEWNTALSTDNLEAESSSYKINEPWTVGTKVVGVMAPNPNLSVLDISNVKIDLNGITTDGANSTVTPTNKNGEGKVISSGTGTVTITARLNGYIDGNPNNCVLTILDMSDADEEDVDVKDVDKGVIKKVTSVGTGAYESGVDLVIKHVWGNKGAHLSIVNLNKNFDLNNGINPHVYAKVVDDGENACSGSVVKYVVTDSNGNLVDAGQGTTNEKGLVDIEIDMSDVNTTGDYKVVANLAENESEKVDSTVSFKRNNAQFVLANEIEKDFAKKEITLTFNRAVDAKTLNTKFFKVVSNGNENHIEAVNVVAGNNAKVVITLQDAIAEDTTVEIKSSFEDNTQIFYFLDQTGVLFSE